MLIQFQSPSQLVLQAQRRNPFWQLRPRAAGGNAKMMAVPLIGDPCARRSVVVDTARRLTSATRERQNVLSVCYRKRPVAQRCSGGDLGRSRRAPVASLELREDVRRRPAATPRGEYVLSSPARPPTSDVHVPVEQQQGRSQHPTRRAQRRTRAPLRPISAGLIGGSDRFIGAVPVGVIGSLTLIASAFSRDFYRIARR
jgi:hypothetical protein